MLAVVFSVESLTDEEEALRPDALLLLGDLDRAGVRAAVIATEAGGRDVVHYSGLEPQASVVIDEHYAKAYRLNDARRHGQVLGHVARRLGVPVESMVSVESEADRIEPAQQAGVAWVAALARGSSAQLRMSLRAQGADAVLVTLWPGLGGTWWHALGIGRSEAPDPG